MTQTKVFISYARTDDYLNDVPPAEEHSYHHDPKRSFTRRLYNALTAAGFDVWWDRENMPGRGLSFLDEIKKAVSECDFLVYVAGEKALTSDYVRAEWQHALSQCIPVIPVLRHIDFPQLPPEIKDFSGVDMRDMAFFGDKVEKLVNMLSDRVAVATLHGVPALPDWYIERGNDVQDLQESLRADAIKPVIVTTKEQTVTLQGMGGMGKTTLATALCRLCDIRYSFHDGVFWLEMGKTPSITTRQGDIGEAFGENRNEFDEQRGKSRLSNLLKDKAVLIVLDDVWEHQHVEAFRVNAPQSRILVTTRNGRIHRLLGVDNHEIDNLSPDEGVALIGKRLGRDPDADNPHIEDEKAIVAMLGGHTLSISIAAAKIAEWGLDAVPDFRQRLEARKASGESPLPDLRMHEEDKNYNLELSLSESYIDLSDEMKNQFRALGVFAEDGTFDLQALQAIWQMSDQYGCKDRVAQFVALSLLTKTETGRFELHGLLRDYARALSSEDELAENERRHFEFYELIHGNFTRNNDEDNHNAIEADWENILSAVQWSYENEAVKAVDWVNALRYFMLMRRTNEERLALFHNTLKIAQDNKYQQGEANILRAIGNVHLRKNEYEEAVLRYEEALPLYEAIGARMGQANSLQALGDVHRMKNEYEEAVLRYEEALPLYEAIGDRMGQANSLQALGDVHLRKSEYEEAVLRYEEALPLYEAIGDRLGQANNLQALGDVHRMKNEYEQAVLRYKEAFALGQSIGDFPVQLNTLRGLAFTYQAQGDLENACRYARQFLELTDQHPFFKDHPITQNHREIFASWGCDKE